MFLILIAGRPEVLQSPRSKEIPSVGDMPGWTLR